MADRFDKSLARRPAADPQPRRDEATLPDDDPLVELARIVSGNESFDQILGSRYRTPAEPPRPAAQPRAQQPRDFSFDLEAELLNDLHSSFDPSARQAEPPARPSAPVTPRAVEPPRHPPQRVDLLQPRGVHVDDRRGAFRTLKLAAQLGERCVDHR